MRIVDWGDGFTRWAQYWLIRFVALLLLGNVVVLVTDGRRSPAPASPMQASDQPAGAGEAVLPSIQPSTTTTTAKAARQASVRRATTTSTTDAPAPAAPARAAWNGDYVFEVRLEPTCARVGEPFTITARVAPYSAIGVIATHADGDTHKTMWGTTAEADGAIVRSWPAPAAPGPGKVLVGATTQDGRLGGTTIDFRIVEATESC